MIFFTLVALSTILLAMATWIGVRALERAYSAGGELIEVEGGTIHVVDIGPKDTAGPPLVLLHGASSNLLTMRLPLGDRLAQRHRVILLDRPGHGWSRADREKATLAGHGRMIELALQRMGIPPVILVAHSLAGALAVRMTLDHPERVNSAMNEFLRLFSSAPMTGRKVPHDTVVNGHTMRAGEILGVFWGAGNFDPDYIDRPFEVDFQRPNARNTTFALGPHMCLGQHLARLELEAMLKVLLEVIPQYSLIEEGIVAAPEVASIFGYAKVPVRIG